MPAKEGCCHKQMGYSHAEFRRTLPAAVEPFSPQERAGRFELSDGSGRRVFISLGPEKTRRIASLQIPTTGVDFTFVGFSKSQQTKFMQRFERYFQRGGG